jgi:hypothetical protein
MDEYVKVSFPALIHNIIYHADIASFTGLDCLKQGLRMLSLILLSFVLFPKEIFYILIIALFVVLLIIYIATSSLKSVRLAASASKGQETAEVDTDKLKKFRERIREHATS